VAKNVGSNRRETYGFVGTHELHSQGGSAEGNAAGANLAFMYIWQSLSLRFPISVTTKKSRLVPNIPRITPGDISFRSTPTLGTLVSAMRSLGGSEDLLRLAARAVDEGAPVVNDLPSP
jgi:hypothetical protein